MQRNILRGRYQQDLLSGVAGDAADLVTCPPSPLAPACLLHPWPAAPPPGPAPTTSRIFEYWAIFIVQNHITVRTGSTTASWESRSHYLLVYLF